MVAFVAKRVVQAVITLIGLSIIVFLLSRATGDPVHMLLPIEAGPDDYQRVRQELGLDKPLPVQYGIFFSNIVRGDFGDSLRTRAPVMDLVRQRLPYSLALSAVALAITLLLALPLGVISAVKRGTSIDTWVRVVALLGQVLPAFLVGIILIEIVSVRLGWLPAAGASGLSSIILPAFCLSLFIMAGITRLLRSSMLDVLDEEYIKLARLKGIPERSVIWKHAFRNALSAVMTFSGIYFAMTVTMAVAVEVVFAWPGLGRLAYEGITYRDFPVIQAVVLTAGFIVIVVNLIVDILYSYIDPRIKVV